MRRVSNSLCSFPPGSFDDEDIIHVEGNVDPVRDIEIIHEELRLKDEEMIAPIIDKLEKVAVRGGDKKLKPEYVRGNTGCISVVENRRLVLHLTVFASGHHVEDKKLGRRRKETCQILPRLER